MPQNNGRLYIETINGVRQGVSLDDIGAALGCSSRDLGTLCTHPNINVWARFRPMQVLATSYKGVVTNEMRKAVNYGFTLPTNYSTMDYLKSNYENTEYLGDIRLNGWSVTPLTAPYRAADFLDGSNIGNSTVYGYNHNAVPPIEAIGSTQRAIKNTIENGYMSFLCKWSNDDYSIRLEDMLGVFLGDTIKAYFGILLVLTEGADAGSYVIATSDRTIDQATSDDGDVSLGVTTKIYTYNLPASSSYKVYPFLTTTQITQGSVLQIGTIGSKSSVPSTMPNLYLPIIGADVAQINIVNGGLMVEFEAYRTNQTNRITYNLRLTNQDTSPIKTTPIDFYVLPNGYGLTQYDSAWRTHVTMNAERATIPVGGTLTFNTYVTIPSAYTDILYNASSNPKGWCMVGKHVNGQDSANTYTVNITGKYHVIIPPEPAPILH